MGGMPKWGAVDLSGVQFTITQRYACSINIRANEVMKVKKKSFHNGHLQFQKGNYQRLTSKIEVVE